MSNIPIDNYAKFSAEMLALQVSTPAHADVFNERFAQLLVNDVVLKKTAEDLGQALGSTNTQVETLGQALGNTNTQLVELEKQVDDINASSKELISTLNKGSTSLTFTDESITSSSTIDVYSSVYGVSPKNMSISDNTLTLIFKEQETDVDVKVVIS